VAFRFSIRAGVDAGTGVASLVGVTEQVPVAFASRIEMATVELK
jgi:hypothetical protein